VSDILVKIRDLHFSRGHRKIFDGISLDIPRQGITAIMGPSGTGKTTLLKLIGGQLTPDQGTIEVDGLNVHQLSTRKLFELRQRMGMLFQSGALLTDLSVFENVAYPLRLSVFENVAYPLREHTKLNEAMIRYLVLLKLNAVGLRGAADLAPAELSGGMARRVALARAIALDPMMIMYDEPFTGQDPISLAVIVSLISELNRALKICSIVVSHDVQETFSISHQVHLISAGKLIESGSPESLQNSQSAWTRQFVHGDADGPVHFHYPAKPLLDDLYQRS
jgi:phospholipid/cholesterol/gamma-HCH transport system ATP-binding protein